jgi:hypothetical protein
MPLQPPKRTSAGYYVALVPPVQAPRLHWTTAGTWEHTAEWSAWADSQRSQLLGELLSHGNWFSKPPRRDILEPLFSPWDSRNMQGVWGFFCKAPETPGESGRSGSANWLLTGLIMSSASIYPVWSLDDVKQDEDLDTISLFGDGETVDGDDVDEKAKQSEDTREIQLEEIEEASPASGPTHIRSREWETRKFLAKERVREARLKAQIATRLAHKEESRFYTQYGDLDETESQFSEYDLTEDEGSDGSSDESNTNE